MEVIYKYTEGSQSERPLEVDTVSSPTRVYLRKDIRQVTHVDEETGEEYTLWGYDEAQLTQGEYTEYLSRANNEQLTDTMLTMADMLVDITLLQLGL